MKAIWLGLVLMACGGTATEKERYAVGTHLFTGSMLTGPSKCTFDAPPGVLDGSKILAPGTITEKCESGHTEVIIAEFADHLALDIPKSIKVGAEVSYKFTLRNAANQELTPTLREAGSAKLSDGCTALGPVGRGGAQDTGRDRFESSTAVAAGTCKVTVEIELPTAAGMKVLRAEQDITVN